MDKWLKFRPKKGRELDVYITKNDVAIKNSTSYSLFSVEDFRTILVDISNAIKSEEVELELKTTE